MHKYFEFQDTKKGWTFGNNYTATFGTKNDYMKITKNARINFTPVDYKIISQVSDWLY